MGFLKHLILKVQSMSITRACMTVKLSILSSDSNSDSYTQVAS